jgi:hypothetical protein
MKIMKLNKKYFLIFILLLVSEIIITKYASGFIRHTFGDYLVVLLGYSFIKSVTKMSAKSAAIVMLVISFGVEFLQLTNTQNYYPIEYSKLFKLVLGTSFSLGDLIAYFFGFLTILILENNLKYWYEAK